MTLPPQQPPLGAPPAGYPPPAAYPPRMSHPPAYGPPPQQMQWSYPGYAAPPAARPPVRHTSHVKLISLLLAGLVVVVGAFLIASHLATPGKKTYTCPPSCPHPPVGNPVASLPKFTAQDGSFTVDVYPDNNVVDMTHDANSVTEKVHVDAGHQGTIVLLGIPAHGQTAQQVVTGLVRDNFSSARQSYVLPNATVGFQSGYGEIDDLYPQTTNGSYDRQRLVILAAVKNDLALVAVGEGAYSQFSPQNGDGHPSGANVWIANVMDQLVNSFTWKGDPPR